MFSVDHETGAITMHRGDTGAFNVAASRSSGADWTEADRLLFTVRAADGTVVLQRFYRLDDDEGLGNGVVKIQFHNNDTDTWDNGSYDVERRYIVNPYWNGTAPTGMVTDALTAGVRIVNGDIVRVPEKGHTTMTLSDIYGEV